MRHVMVVIHRNQPDPVWYPIMVVHVCDCKPVENNPERCYPDLGEYSPDGTSKTSSEVTGIY